MHSFISLKLKLSSSRDPLISCHFKQKGLEGLAIIIKNYDVNEPSVY